MQIDITSIKTAELTHLAWLFDQNGFGLRVVGGAVRDLVLGVTPKDIDLATDATPQEVINLATDNGFRVIPTGLQHGTVTVLVGDEEFEITTLRVDVETDGRHAEVVFTRDWRTDAERRDLTFNAMSVDLEGNLFDFFGGVDDLQNKRICFVGKTAARIEEDFLRILRAFRFAARFEAEFHDDDLVDFIVMKGGLRQISGERIWMEMAKIMAAPDAVRVLGLMARLGVLDQINLISVNGKTAEELLVVKDKLNRFEQVKQFTNDPALLLAALTSDVDGLFKAWKFDAKTRDRVRFVLENDFTFDLDAAKAMVLDGVSLSAMDDLLTFQGNLTVRDALMNWDVPTFPVTGQMLLDEGMKPGPEVGRELKRRRNNWVVQGAK